MKKLRKKPKDKVTFFVHDLKSAISWYSQLFCKPPDSASKRFARFDNEHCLIQLKSCRP